MDQRSSELEKNTEKGLEKIENGVSKLEQKTSDDLETNVDITGDIAEEPEQIKEQIEETRNQMSETISAIEEKLSFANISDQVSDHISSAVTTAKDAVYDAAFKKVKNIMKSVSKEFEDFSENFGEAGTYVVKSARQNPLPLALIGLGLGMLLVYKTTSGSDKKSGGKKRHKYDDGNRGKSTFKQFADTSGDYLNTAQKKVGDAAGSAYEGVSTAAASAYEGVTGAAVSAYEGASSFAGSTGEQVQTVARKAQSRYEDTLQENPLAIGAMALAVGAAVGLSIPISSYENQFMGETKDNLFQTAEDTAREALSKVQESAGDFISNVREEAKGKANG